jgi:drug/metabolite transporter (DMT)-like permease
MKNLNSESLHHPIKGAMWMVFAGSAFAVVNVTNQYLGFRLELASTTIAFYQYFIALILMSPWLLQSAMKEGLYSQHLTHHVVRVALAVAGIQIWTWALSEGVPIWQAIALVMTSPLFATIGSGVFLKENVSAARWCATFAGFIGGMIILEPWKDNFNIYSLAPVVAAIFWAGYSLMVRDITHHDSAQSIVFYLLLLMTPFNFLVGFGQLSWPQGLSWWLLLLSGALTAVAQQGIARAYANAEASFVQPFDHAKLPLNVLAGWLVFSWVPPGRLWLGAIIIIGASLALAHWEHSQSRDKVS